MAVIYEKFLVLTDITGKNKSNKNQKSNKGYYVAYDNVDGVMITKWGRIESFNNPLQTGVSVGRKSASMRTAEKKVAEQKKKGYMEIEVANANNFTSVNSQSDLSSIAIRDIHVENGQTEVEELLKYFAQVNRHDIDYVKRNTNLTYNQETGLFRTAMGIVTPNTVDKARNILNTIAQFVEADDKESDGYVDLLNQYFMLIPQTIPRPFQPKYIFKNNNDIQEQAKILDSLVDSYNYVMNAQADDTDTTESPRIFHTKLSLVDDTQIFDEIEKIYNDTKQSRHVCSGLKLKRVYALEIENSKKSFDQKVANMGNTANVFDAQWHGSSTSNILSILKSGLIIPKSSAPNVTGRMFGDGIYTSDQATKALNYSYGYWGNKNTSTSRYFMFLCDVAMGKYYVPSSSEYNLPKPGYDSTFAKGGNSSVMNNEMIVYDLSQINLKYLCEFE